MAENVTLKTVSLKDLWKVFVRCWIIMIVAAIAATMLYKADVKSKYGPQYSSTATLYVLGDWEDMVNEDGEKIFDIDKKLSIAKDIISDFSYLLKSRTVLEPVMEQLELTRTYSSLKSSIVTSNPANTRVLEVTVKAAKAEEAKATVDALCDKAIEALSDTVWFGKVEIFEYGTLNPNPINPLDTSNSLTCGVFAAIAVYAVSFAVYVFVGYIRSEKAAKQLKKENNADGSAKPKK